MYHELEFLSMYTFKKAKAASDNFILLCILVKPACTRSVKLFFISYTKVPKQHRCSVQKTVLEFSFQRSTVFFLSYTDETSFTLTLLTYYCFYYCQIKHLIGQCCSDVLRSLSPNSLFWVKWYWKSNEFINIKEKLERGDDFWMLRKPSSLRQANDVLERKQIIWQE